MIDFPASPTVGQNFAAPNGVTYQWNGTVWVSVSAGGSSGASITVSDTPPASPTAGALWWNSVLGTMFIYYNDGNSTQWVPAAPSATLPTPISAGDVLVYCSTGMAINTGTNVPVVSTPSIGLAGQKWEIETCLLMGTNQANTTICGVDIFDGTTSLAGGGGVVGWNQANWWIPQFAKAQKVLTGPTIFTARATGNASGCLVTGNGYGGPAGTASWISARRLY